MAGVSCRFHDQPIRATRHVEQQRQLAGRAWRRTIYQQVEREVKTGTPLAIRRMCTLTGVSRAGFYRLGVSPGSASMGLRDRVQRVSLSLADGRAPSEEARGAGRIAGPVQSAAGKSDQRLLGGGKDGAKQSIDQPLEDLLSADAGMV